MVYQCCGCKTLHTGPLGTVTMNGNHEKYGPAKLPKIGSTCAECDHVFHVGHLGTLLKAYISITRLLVLCGVDHYMMLHSFKTF
jgi:hypothetical protein